MLVCFCSKTCLFKWVQSQQSNKVHSDLSQDATQKEIMPRKAVTHEEACFGVWIKEALVGRAEESLVRVETST